MSEGIAIPREAAEQLLGVLRDAWARVAPECRSAVGAVELVGSARRGALLVRDLDLVAPLPAAALHGPYREGSFAWTDDPLFAAVNACRTGPLEAPRLTLFPRDEWPTSDKRWTEEISGVKPFFRCAQLEAVTKTLGRVKVQVNRYTPQNRGWITAMRTGPGEFGVAFLVTWKRRWGITGEASVDGHLVDREGTVVPVADEAALFAQCGLTYIEPERREAWAKAVCP